MEPMFQLVNSQYIPDDLKLIHMHCLFKFSDFIWYINRETFEEYQQFIQGVLVTAGIGVLVILIMQCKSYTRRVTRFISKVTKK